MLTAKIRRQLTALIKNPATFSTLSGADRLACRLVLRDMLASSDEHHAPTEADRQLIWNAASVIPAPDIPRHEGAFISFHPTRRLCFVCFIEAAQIDPAWRPHFLPVPELPELVTAYVDPAEYHFRSTDTVLPLNPRFEGEEMAARAARIRTLAPSTDGAWQFKLEASDALRGALLGLDGLGLYGPPMHTDTLGGELMVFRAEALASVLDGVARRVLPAFRLKRFAHVNPTFRLRRLSPGDEAVEGHHDTPFCDLSASQISRYTLRVYLTGGSAAPVISAAGGAVERMPALDAVLIDQQHAQDIAPFVEGATVVLQAELIYTEKNLLVAPELVELFSRARSLTGDQSPEEEVELLAAK